MPEYNSNQESPISNNKTTFAKPKKSKKVFYITLGVILFILAITITIGVLILNKQDDTVKKVDESSVSMVYVKTFQSNIDKDSGVAESVFESKNTSNEVLYRLEDGSWIAADDNVDVSTLSSNSDKVDIIKTYHSNTVERLKTDGLTELKSLDYSAKAYDPAELYVQYFASDSMVCNLRNFPNTSSNVTTYTLILSCALVTDFSTNKGTLSPFAKSYASSDKKVKQDVYLSDSVIQEGAVKDYQNAQLNITTIGTNDISIAEFYKTPDGSWHLFTITKDRGMISCSDYVSDDMINAFAGFICFDSTKNTNSTVHKVRPAPVYEAVPGGSDE